MLAAAMAALMLILSTVWADANLPIVIFIFVVALGLLPVIGHVILNYAILSLAEKRFRTPARCSVAGIPH